MLFGCAQKSAEASRAVYVEIDAGRLKFADFGFLDDFGDARKLEVYSLGSPVFGIEKDGRVAFEMDVHEEARISSVACNSYMDYESVCGTGNAVIADDAQKRAYLVPQNQLGLL